MSRAKQIEPISLAGSITDETVTGGVSFGTSFANSTAGIIRVTGLADLALIWQTYTAVVTAEAKFFLSPDSAQPADDTEMYPLADNSGVLRTFALGAVLKGFFPLGNLTARWLLCQLRGVGGTNTMRALLQRNQRAVEGAVMPTANYPLCSVPTVAPNVADFVSPVVNVGGAQALTLYVDNTGSADANLKIFGHYQIAEPATAALYNTRAQAGTELALVVPATTRAAISLEQGNYNWVALQAQSAAGAGEITAFLTGLLSST